MHERQEEGELITFEKRMPFYGELKCTKEDCQNRAYWNVSETYFCGVHSKKRPREALPKDPNKKEKRQKRHQEDIKEAYDTGLANKARGKRGKVICSKLRMFRNPEHVPKYIKIFPNYKHQNRKDGFGCSDLSPKSLGPIHHGEPGLPIALNLENYHQSSKCFKHETDSKGDPKEEFWMLLKERYQDPEPKRHKFDKKILQQQNQNVNVPLFTVRVWQDGTVHRYNYLECRYFYCKQYELLAPQTESFKKLKSLLQDGVNLQLIGYDGYPVNDSPMNHYLDTTRPFGHELVLYVMLTEEDPSKYPWNVFKTQHPELYRGMTY